MNETLSVPFDLKEDLRLRMMDLEKKLADSEEERSKMEKTCNALMRSFREEERMRYITLNKKYEKFLQDCMVRKRRNEIILRSLCRIEDRSKALFAKTERLKLLKNRQIAYLKISDVKKDEIPSQFSSLPQKNIDVLPKSVHWKIPLATHQKQENLQEIEDLFCNRTSDVISGVLISDMISTGHKKYKQHQSEEVQGYDDRKNSESTLLNDTFCTEVPQNKLNLVKIGSDLCESLKESPSDHIKSEKSFRSNDQRKSENDCASKHETLNGNNNDKNLLEISESITSHQESVKKLEKTFSLKEEHSDKENSNKKHYSYHGKIIGKNDTESSEKDPVKKQNNLQDELLPRINQSFVPFGSINVTLAEKNQENVSKNTGKENETFYQREETLTSLPVGLDGIDYQNETYPESYYEQPIYHHNHTSITADVILEEDETEENEEEEEEEKEKEDVTTDQNFGKIQTIHEDSHGSNIWVHSSRSRILNESNVKSAMNKNYAIDANCFDESYGQIKSQKSDSEKSSEAEQFVLGTDESKRNKNESLVSDQFNKNKPPVKSNLIHLLESDSESYQIEHGDDASENEVSDFDLSFQ